MYVIQHLHDLIRSNEDIRDVKVITKLNEALAILYRVPEDLEEK